MRAQTYRQPHVCYERLGPLSLALPLPRVEYLPDFLSAVSGHAYTLDELLLAGEWIAAIRQAFNVR